MLWIWQYAMILHQVKDLLCGIKFTFPDEFLDTASKEKFVSELFGQCGESPRIAPIEFSTPYIDHAQAVLHPSCSFVQLRRILLSGCCITCQHHILESR